MSHKNNFGFLRLLFATLVVVSHSPALIDGNRSREILTGLFGTLSFGELAVDGFFIISGYLIVKSYLSSWSVPNYLLKRVLRIYPGFLVCYAICIAIVGPLAGAHLTLLGPTGWFSIFSTAILLRQPSLPDVFLGLPYPELNGAAWTIAYEFRCYLLVVAFGTLGLFRRRSAFLIVTILLLLAIPLPPDGGVPSPWGVLVGKPIESVRLLAMFCTGAIFFLYRDVIRYSTLRAIFALIGLCTSLFFPMIASQGTALFGAFLIFWLAMYVNSGPLARINNDEDVSYGLYLYAWPIQSLILFYTKTNSPLVLTTIALPLAWLLGLVSWRTIERPCLRLKPKTASAARLG